MTENTARTEATHPLNGEGDSVGIEPTPSPGVNGKSDAKVLIPEEKEVPSKNKGGRPKGRKNNSTLVKEALQGDFLNLLKKDFKQIVKAVCTEAKNGNMEAAKMVLNKIMPNAGGDATPHKGDFGINIIISDMPTKTIEGEIIENDVVKD